LPSRHPPSALAHALTTQLLRGVVSMKILPRGWSPCGPGASGPTCSHCSSKSFRGRWMLLVIAVLRSALGARPQARGPRKPAKLQSFPSPLACHGPRRGRRRSKGRCYARHAGRELVWHSNQTATHATLLSTAILRVVASGDYSAEATPPGDQTDTSTSLLTPSGQPCRV